MLTKPESKPEPVRPVLAKKPLAVVGSSGDSLPFEYSMTYEERLRLEKELERQLSASNKAKVVTLVKDQDRPAPDPEKEALEAKLITLQKQLNFWLMPPTSAEVKAKAKTWTKLVSGTTPESLAAGYKRARAREVQRQIKLVKGKIRPVSVPLKEEEKALRPLMEPALPPSGEDNSMQALLWYHAYSGIPNNYVLLEDKDTYLKRRLSNIRVRSIKKNSHSDLSWEYTSTNPTKGWWRTQRPPSVLQLLGHPKDYEWLTFPFLRKARIEELKDKHEWSLVKTSHLTKAYIKSIKGFNDVAANDESSLYESWLETRAKPHMFFEETTVTRSSSRFQRKCAVFAMHLNRVNLESNKEVANTKQLYKSLFRPVRDNVQSTPASSTQVNPIVAVGEPYGEWDRDEKLQMVRDNISEHVQQHSSVKQAYQNSLIFGKIEAVSRPVKTSAAVEARLALHLTDSYLAEERVRQVIREECHRMFLDWSNEMHFAMNDTAEEVFDIAVAKAEEYYTKPVISEHLDVPTSFNHRRGTYVKSRSGIYLPERWFK